MLVFVAGTVFLFLLGLLCAPVLCALCSLLALFTVRMGCAVCAVCMLGCAVTIFNGLLFGLRVVQ